MVDKLQDYQGTLGQLHTIRDKVKDKLGDLKERRERLHLELNDKISHRNTGDDNYGAEDSNDYDYGYIFRKKTRWELIRLCSTVMGIEFSYSAITAFSSPVLLEIGISHELVSFVWILSPFLGFFLTPVTGSLSDRCTSRFGRRRIFIIVFALFQVIGLMLISHGTNIGNYFGDDMCSPSVEINAEGPHFAKQNSNNINEEHKSRCTISIIFIIIGIIFSDFCADAMQSPSRAYLLDVCTEEDQTRGLSSFTILAGLGGTIGYALGSVDWDNLYLGHLLGGHVKTVFGLTCIFCIASVILSITTFREIPLDDLNRVEQRYLNQQEVEDHLSTVRIGNRRPTEDLELKEPFINNTDDTNTKIRSESVVSAMLNQDVPTLSEYLKSIIHLPHSLRILLITNVLCWMSHVSYSLYFTDYVGEAVFGGDPKAPLNSKPRLLYEEGIRFACIGLSIYSFSCLICSLYLEECIKKYGLKKVYRTNLLIDAISMLSMYYLNSKLAAVMFSFASGILYCTLFTIPYILVAHYHTLNVFDVDSSGEHVQSNQVRGLGTDISIIGSSVFIAQFTLSLIMSVFVSWYGSSIIPLTCAIFSISAMIGSSQILYLDL